MLNKIICSGVGGQGVLTLGMILAEAAAAQDQYVTWVPSYGSEMRGGAASCQIKISDEPVGSPYIQEIDVLVAMNEASITQFGDMVTEDGFIIINSSIIENVPDVKNGKIIAIPANEIANNNNNPKGAGVSIIGAIIACTGMLPFDGAKQAIEEYFNNKGIAAGPNVAVFTEGYKYAEGLL